MTLENNFWNTSSWLNHYYEVIFELKLFKLTIKLFTFDHLLSFTKHIILGAVGRMHVFLHDHHYIDHNQMLFYRTYTMHEQYKKHVKKDSSIKMKITLISLQS